MAKKKTTIEEPKPEDAGLSVRRFGDKPAPEGQPTVIRKDMKLTKEAAK